MKGVSGKQIFTYVVIFAILGVVAAYFMGYKKNNEKAASLEASNNTLEERVESLKGYYDSQKKYQDEMAAMVPEIDKVLSKFVSDVREEDLIMQAVISQRTTEVQYNQINMKQKEALLTIGEDVVKGANVEKYQKQISFDQKTTTYTNKLDYHNLKLMIQSIFDSEYNIGIKKISYTKAEATESKLFGIMDEETGEITYVTNKSLDETVGILDGTIDLEFYAISGNGVEYTKPDMKEYLSGTEDFFGLTVPEEEEEEEE